MHASTIFTTIFAAVAIAAPASTNGITPRAVADTTELAVSAQTMLDAKAAAGCDVLKCIAALAPASIACAAAFAQGGLNPILDAACFASALNNIANPPSGCKNC